ncbi:DDE-type integrase/transposase/recombinase [Cytobacillus gottheilii]|uniref:DDE-type integrase/transposase/recombinase n=1 Tax=Cytobacillus gottheilii TaxID=859144 RepID=UPI002495865D|nr:DDE-type integrase/transposase/recombinase [Cytobacillus gottheilii]
MLNQIERDAEFWLYGKKYKVISISPPFIWARREGDSEDIQIEFTKLIAHPTFKPEKSMKFAKNHQKNKYLSLSTISEEKRTKVSERFKQIESLLLFEKIKEGDLRAVRRFGTQYKDLLEENEQIVELTQETLIQRIVMKQGVSRATLMRYLSAYRKSEMEFEQHGIEGLIPKSGRGYTGRKDNKSIEICHPKNPNMVLDVIHTRLSEPYIEIIKEIIETKWLTKQRRKKTDVFESMKILCHKRQLDPSKLKYVTISKMLDRIDKQAVQRMRQPKHASNMYDEIARGYANQEALFPLDIVQIDHTQFDIDVIDDISGYAIGRPWITLGIDVYSRMVWCMYVSFEDPSANVVRKAIEHGVFFKNTNYKYGTLDEWEVFGIPNTIYVDNGADFKSADVKRLVEEVLQSELMHRPVETPRYGAVIERLFGTLNSKFIHRLPGTRKSSVKDLGEYEPEKEATLTLSELCKLLTIFITDVYSNSKHEGLPPDSPTPRIRFREGIQNAGYPRWIDENEKDYYKIEFLSSAKRQYGRDGIQFENRLYKAIGHPELITDNKEKTKYLIKHDVDDISKIYLKHPKTNEYIEMLCSNPSYEVLQGVNSYTYKKILEIQRKEGEQKRKSIPSDEHVLKGLERIQDEYENLYKKRRRARKQIARMNLSVSLEMPKTSIPSKKSREEELFEAAKRLEHERMSNVNGEK